MNRLNPMPTPEGWAIFRNAKGARTVVAPDGQVIESEYSLEFLKLLFEIKSRANESIWYVDEVNRPSKIFPFLDWLIHRSMEGSIRGKQALDFGAGIGASCICLARIGFQSIVGMEPNSNYVEAAKLRVRDLGLSDTIQFIQPKDTQVVPFENGSFDVVLCSGVLEHILPPMRKGIIKELWRVLAPRGLLIISETPNLLFPYGCHFPFLYFTPWMPIDMVKLYGFMRGRVPWEMTREEIFLKGVRGCTWWGILRWIEDHAILVNGSSSGLEEEFLKQAVLKGDKGMKLFVKKSIVLVSKSLLAPFGIPFCSLFPFLNLVIRKPSRG